MIKILAIGAGAGVASALMTLSLMSGTVLAILLSYASILPLFIIGLGFGHLAAGFALCAGGLLISLIHSPVLSLLWVATTALPAWALSYCVQVSQQKGRAVPADCLMLIAALSGALSISLVFYIGGFDHDAYQMKVRAAVSALVDLRGLPFGGDKDNGIAVLSAMLAYTLAIGWVFWTTFMLYLAARIVKASGLLAFEWHPLETTRLPKSFGIGMAFFAALSFLSESFIGHASSLMLASGLAAFSLSGFAALHALSRPLSFRPALLATAYGVVMLFGFPIVIMMLLGLADSQYDLRTRFKPL